MVGDVDVDSVGCNPGAVSLCCINDLGCAVGKIAGEVRVQACDGRYSELGNLGLGVEESK